MGLGGLTDDQCRNEIGRRVRQISYSTKFTGTDVMRWTLDLSLYHDTTAMRDDDDSDVRYFSLPLPSLNSVEFYEETQHHR